MNVILEFIALVPVQRIIYMCWLSNFFLIVLLQQLFFKKLEVFIFDLIKSLELLLSALEQFNLLLKQTLSPVLFNVSAAEKIRETRVHLLLLFIEFIYFYLRACANRQVLDVIIKN